jgi:hypothetical protein
MMRVRCTPFRVVALAALLLPATLAVTSVAQAASAGRRAADARTVIAKLEHRWLAAVSLGGHRDDLRAILADDFIDVDWQGRIRHKADLIAAPTQSHVTQRVTDLRIRTWQNTAVATGVNHVQATDKGWSIAVSFTDVFVRIDGRWRAVSAQETLRKPSKS